MLNLIKSTVLTRWISTRKPWDRGRSYRTQRADKGISAASSAATFGSTLMHGIIQHPLGSSWGAVTEPKQQRPATGMAMASPPNFVSSTPPPCPDARPQLDGTAGDRFRFLLGPRMLRRSNMASSENVFFFSCYY